MKIKEKILRWGEMFCKIYTTNHILNKQMKTFFDTATFL